MHVLGFCGNLAVSYYLDRSSWSVQQQPWIVVSLVNSAAVCLWSSSCALYSLQAVNVAQVGGNQQSRLAEGSKVANQTVSEGLIGSSRYSGGRQQSDTGVSSASSVVGKLL